MTIRLKRTLILTVPFGKSFSYIGQSFRLCVGVVDIMCGSKAYTSAPGKKLVISSHSSLSLPSFRVIVRNMYLKIFYRRFKVVLLVFNDS